MKGYYGLLFILASCLPAPEFEQVNCTASQWVENTEIAQILDQYQYGDIYVFESDWIIEGQVISSDEYGEFYKSLIVQDADGQAIGLNFWLDRRALYLDFRIGEKLKINLKGLAIGTVYGMIQVGKADGNKNELRPLVFDEWGAHIETTCEINQAIVHSLEEEVQENVLYEFRDIYFDNEYYIGSRNSSDYIHELYQRNACSFPMKIGELQIDGFNDFKNELLPAGFYSLKIISQRKYGRTYFSPRSQDDFSLSTQAICEDYSFTTSLSDLNEISNGQLQHFDAAMEKVLKLQLISSFEEGNFDNELIFQDDRFGVKVLMHALLDNELVVWGGWYLIRLNGMTLFKNDNNLELGYWNQGQERLEKLPQDVFKKHFFFTNEITSPLENHSRANNTYLRLKDWEFDPQTWDKRLVNSFGPGFTNRLIKSCNSGQTILVSTLNNSKIGSEIIQSKLYDFQGVYNNGKLRLNYSADMIVKENDANCSWELPEIRFTEIADPKNDHSARYIELTNYSNFQVNLSSWKLLKYINSNQTASGTGLLLNDLIIGPNESIIVANFGFDKYFSKKADITSSYISGNGDDVYQLINENGDEVHIYGRIGGDAKNEGWSYQDGIIKWINDQWNLTEDADIPKDADPWAI